jgi:putative transcription antitermination factor YqgF
MDGTEGQQAAWVRDYSEALGQVVAPTIVLWDERLSTAEAREILGVQGRSTSSDPVDAVAAAVILQNYLDTQAGEPFAFGKEYCR